MRNQPAHHPRHAAPSRLVIPRALALGVAVTRLYDRKGYHRIAAYPADADSKA